MQADSREKEFTDLFEEMSDQVFRFCLLRVSDRDEAIDIMEESFMKFWDYFRDHKNSVGNKRAMLFKITRNLIIDYYRKKKAVRIEDAETDIKNDIRFSENMVLTNSMAREVIDQINKLDPKYRECVYFRLVENFSPKDIAKMLDISENNVSVRINRGVDMIRRSFNI